MSFSTRAYLRALSHHPRRRLLSTTPHAECDIVIVGGGPAGLALASALGSCQAVRRDLRVVLVEAGDLGKVHRWIPAPGTFSNRVSSLTNSSQAFLKDTGAWEHVDARRTMPIEEMQVWDGISDARITFSASEAGLEDGMARLTENLNLQRGLLRHLEACPSVELLDKTKVQSILPDSAEKGGWPLVHLDNGQVLRARLLVGADGFNSPVRAYAQIPSFGWSYDTQAIVATMEHAPRGAFERPNTIAYQRFLSTGPIAFLPLSATTSTLVWSTRPDLASVLTASEPGVLASVINAAFRLPEVSLGYLRDRIMEAHCRGTPLDIPKEIKWREESEGIDPRSAYSCYNSMGEKGGVPAADSEMVPPVVTWLQAGTVASFPLRFNHTETYIGSRSVLIGDAAHTVHPLAGQGLNLGLGDAECLARCIEQAVVQGGDIGSHTALIPYAQERYMQNHTVMGAIDKLHKVYSTTFEPVVWARSVGVEVLNEMDTVKKALMMTAGAGRHAVDGGAVLETLMEGARIGGEMYRVIVNSIMVSGSDETEGNAPESDPRCNGMETEMERMASGAVMFNTGVECSQIEEDERAVNEAYERIIGKMKQVEEAHSRLGDRLAEMIRGHGEERRSARDEVIAGEIEIGLIKLSVIRGRAYRELYSTEGLEAGYGKLKKEQGRLLAEERKMDAELGVYAQMRDVVQDWIVIQKEMEECQIDLQRFG